MLPMRRPDLLAREIDGEVVILDRRSGMVHQLNATASWIWRACDGRLSATQIAGRLAASFVDPPHTVVTDVWRALSDLERLGLVVDNSDA